MRQRKPQPARSRLDIRLDTEIVDQLNEIADRRTFGNRSALVEQYLTEALAAEQAKSAA